ncbi:MAG: hypothetical protein AAF560_04870 [Acidobacteriota bacterium]
MGRLPQLLRLLREPISAEKRALLEARWSELPETLRVGWQVVGQHHPHCGYTLGPSFCSFGCSHCYLPRNANRVPLPTLDDMKAQIDANRRALGPGGGLQITGGDVVDAYWRAGRQDELVEVVQYANQAGVVPMLMTHGQQLLEAPEYLSRLVSDGGLRKLAIHIDITMAGRPGFPINRLRREADLHPLRERFVDLIFEVRRATGVRFSAAHTVTVTERNLDSLGEIFDWLVADPRHLDAFRMLSLQPEADVGRTRFSQQPVTPQETWGQVCSAIGQDLPLDSFLVGDPECSHFSSLLVVFPEADSPAVGESAEPIEPQVINLFDDSAESRAFVSYMLSRFGGVGARGASHLEANVRRLGLVLRHPGSLWKVARYARVIAKREGLGPGDLWRAVRGRTRFGVLSVVQHNFMSADEVAEPRSERVQQRLAACSFRGAVQRGGDWVDVPMCTMNARERESLYDAQIDATQN